MKRRDVSHLWQGNIGSTIEVTDRFGTYLVRQGWKSELTAADRDWRDYIRKGDILKRGDTLRIVREVQYKQNGILVSVDFTIMRCSWTHRCNTGYGRSDLKTLGFTPTGKKAKLNKRIDKEIELEIRKSDRRKLDCCDVRGIG